MSLVPLITAIIAVASLFAGVFLGASLSLSDPDDEMAGFYDDERWDGNLA
ncbi:MAG: hypothetical protein H0U58_01900 [Chloroflexi bacterium]|nr:hypothetical protein [Chloroflexota bacterium]